VLRDLLLGLFGLAMGCGMLYGVLRPAPAIWRGDESRIPILPWRQTGQTYLAFLLWTVPVSIALAVFGADILFYAFTENKEAAAAIAKPAVGLALLGTPFILVNVFVEVFKRPRCLMPPPYRSRAK